MTDYEDQKCLDMARTLTRLQAWEALPPSEFQEKMKAKEAQRLAVLQPQKEVA